MQYIFLMILSLNLLACQGFGPYGAASYKEDDAYKTADALLAEEKIADALPLLAELHTRYPQQSALTLLLADTYRRNHACHEAIPLYQALQQQATADALLPLQEGLGLCYLQMGKFKESGALLALVLQQDASHWRTINAFGVTLAVTDHVKEALHYFELARELSNDHPAILNNMGLAYGLTQQYTEAQPLLEQALAALPAVSEHRKRISLNLALILGASGQSEAAKQAASPYLTATELHHNLAVYALLAHNTALAKAHLTEAMTHSNHYPKSSWELFQSLEKEDK